MTLSDLASIGSLVSGVAVLVSLVYLSIQVRQADKNQRTSLQQGTSERGIDIVRHWGDPHIAQAYMKTMAGDTNLGSLEAFQLNMHFRASLLSFQDNFLLQRVSLIDDIQLESIRRTIKVLMTQPVLRAMWNLMRDSFAPEFAEFVETLARDLPLAAPYDFGARLKAAVEEVETAAAK